MAGIPPPRSRGISGSRRVCYDAGRKRSPAIPSPLSHARGGASLTTKSSPASRGSGVTQERDFQESGGGVLRQAVGMRCRAIRAHVGRMPWQLLAVSPSGYSAEVPRPERLRTAENRRLVAEIRVIHAASRRTTGSPRGYATLQAQAQRIGVPRWLGAGVSCRAKYAQPEVCRGCTQPSVGQRHHVGLDHRGLARSGGGAGSLRASSHGVGDGEPPDSGVGDGCAHHGRDPPTPGARHPTDRGAPSAATRYRGYWPHTV